MLSLCCTPSYFLSALHVISPCPTTSKTPRYGSQLIATADEHSIASLSVQRKSMGRSPSISQYIQEVAGRPLVSGTLPFVGLLPISPRSTSSRSPSGSVCDCYSFTEHPNTNKLSSWDDCPDALALYLRIGPDAYTWYVMWCFGTLYWIQKRATRIYQSDARFYSVS